MIVDVVLSHLLHESRPLASLFTCAVHYDLIGHTLVCDELLQFITSKCLAFHQVCHCKVIFCCKDLCIFVPIKGFEMTVHCIGVYNGWLYILLARYHRANGKIADLSSRCDVDLMVWVACFRPINHLSIRSDADTVDLRSEVWKVLDDGTSSLNCSGSCIWTAEINPIENVAGSSTMPCRPGSML